MFSTLDYDQLEIDLQELSGFRLLKVDRAALIIIFFLNVELMVRSNSDNLLKLR